MECPRCQTENPDTRKFCRKCGEKLLLICPQCGSENLPGDNFCGECGHDLTQPKEARTIDYNRPQSYTPKFLADKILRSRSSIEGERKMVTVLFADVANYTSISEKLDPEEVHQIMDRCFKILMDEIHNYQGTINQFTGDGVMALFGAPLALENHTQNACQAALAIQSALEEYNQTLETKFGITFKMRVGLNSGPVVVGSIGDDLRMDYTAIGDATNLAARMERMAEPGAVLVSNNTYKRVSQQFEFESLGKTEVKGKERPLEVYELKGERYKPRLGLDRQVSSDLVGRDSDLNKLELHVLKVINGEGSIITIRGEPGVGKSRLIAELKGKDSIKRVAFLEGRALAIGKNLSFHPIIDIFKSWAGIREDDPGARSIEKLERTIRSIYPEEVAEVFPFIGTLMGMRLTGKHAERVKGIEGEALEKLILKNVRELLIKAAELAPLVIVVEDLHWADISSIELLESLFRLAVTEPILFINVFRTGYRETGERIVETIKDRYAESYTQIDLQPLDEHHSEALLAKLLNIKGLSHGMREKILKRAGGNPFFIEEIVRSMIDEGAVVLKGGTFEATGKIGALVIPQTINDVLMARIDRLEEKTRDLVKVASVIGRSFFYRILAEVARTVDEIDKRLAYLKEVQLILERKRMEELEYLFKHALAQEAAYESILLQKRKELHLKVADSIEKVFSERLHEFSGMLAYHYSSGEDLDKAEEYLLKAGEEALKASASSEALYYYQEAMQLYLTKYGTRADPDRLAMLEKNIAVALFNKGQYAKAVEYFDSALERWGIRSSKNKIILALTLVSDLLKLIVNLYIRFKKGGRLPDKRDHEVYYLTNRRLLSLGSMDPKRFLIELLRNFTRFHEFDLRKLEGGFRLYSLAFFAFSFSGISLKLGSKILEKGEVFINREDFRDQLSHNLCNVANNFLTGNWHEVKEYDENLVDASLRAGEMHRTQITYLAWHGMMKTDQGAFKEVETYENKLREIWEVYENENARGQLYHVHEKLLTQSRKLHDAQIEADKATSFHAEIGEELRAIASLGVKAKIEILLRDINGAKESLSQAKEWVLKKGRMPPYLIGFYLMSQFLFDLYLLEEVILSHDSSNISEYRKKAYQSGKHAIKNCRKCAPDRTEAFRLMGLYYWLKDSQKKAVKWWYKSITEGEHLGARVELARTYMEIGKRLLEKKSKFKDVNGVSAKEHLEKARIMFEEMDLQWDLDELDKIVGYNQGK